MHLREWCETLATERSDILRRMSAFPPESYGYKLADVRYERIAVFGKGVDMNETYLGDGAYAKMENGAIKLYTFDGIDESEPVYLNKDVWRMLRMYAQKAGFKD